MNGEIHHVTSAQFHSLLWEKLRLHLVTTEKLNSGTLEKYSVHTSVGDRNSNLCRLPHYLQSESKTLWNPSFGIQRSSQINRILSQNNPVPILTTSITKILSSIILLSASMLSQWSSAFRFSGENFAWIPVHECYMSAQAILPNLMKNTDHKANTHSWSWALLEKLPVVQLLENFPAFYGTRRFITAFT
jgi:hypothetical protein